MLAVGYVIVIWCIYVLAVDYGIDVWCFNILAVDSGIQTNLFSPGASWAPKIKELGAQPKTKEPRIQQEIKPIYGEGP